MSDTFESSLAPEPAGTFLHANAWRVITCLQPRRCNQLDAELKETL
ncbi:MAG TPA: hypothetical protein VJ420_11175 [Candidatus Udaeobacter sp.]|nr:hypothetical protein [Candidatus Udaeobacter sp.]